MIFRIILVDIAVIIVFSYLYSLINLYFAKTDIRYKILTGLVFGIIGILSMVFSFDAGSGVIFDGRSIVLSLSGLLGGFVSALVASILTLSFRFIIGGSGMLTGCIVIISTASLGVIVNFIFKKYSVNLTYFRVYLFGLITHVITLALFTTLPENIIQIVLQTIWKPFLLFFPLITVLLYFVLQQRENHIANIFKREQSEKKYQNLFNNMNEAFTLLDVILDEHGEPVDFRFVDINPNFTAITGLTRDETISRTFLELFKGSKKEATHWLHEIGRVAMTLKETTMEEYSEALDKWLLIHAFTPGEAQCAITFSDITDRKKAEKALWESEVQFRTFFDNSIDAMLLTTPDGSILAANLSACEMFERTEEDIIAIGRDALVDKSDPRLEVLLKERENKGKVKGELNLIRSNDVSFPAEISSAVFTDSNGNLKTSMIVHDITERKRSEKFLLASEEKYRALVEQSLTGIYIFDNSKYLYVNNRFCEIFGYSQEEILNTLNPIDVIFSDDQERASENIKKRLSGEVDSVYYVSRGLRKDKSIIWIEVHGTHIKLDDQDVITGTILDITERKKAEEKIRNINVELEQKVQERTKQLEEAVSELEAFAYSVSHDLRAPLRAVDGYTRILTEDFSSYLSEEGIRICSVIRDNTQKMSRLISDLLEFSKVSRYKMQVSEIDMKSMVFSIYHEITTPEQRLKIDLRCDDILPIKGDAILMRQVWANLLSNAIKFSSKKSSPVIRIVSLKNEKFIEYSISDNGAGFDSKFADKLFGVFQRLHSDKEFEGTGVGLAIVERIIRRHGGNVKAEGEKDKGAKIFFSLPYILS